MVDIGKLAVDERPELPGWTSNMFGVDELEKTRERVILESFANDVVRKDDLVKLRLPTRREIRMLLKPGVRHFIISLDASAFFDQIQLDGSVRRFFRIPGGLVSAVLPMGFRAACEVADGVASALADFTLPDGTRIIVYIDNFFIIGTCRRHVLEAAAELCRRCDKTNVLLNDVPTEASARQAFLEELVDRQTVDILGETWILAPDMTFVTLTGKSVSKLQTALELVQRQRTGIISRRQLAAIFGVVLFATSVLSMSPAPFWNAMSAFRKLASAQGSWNATADRLNETAFCELTSWCNALMQSPPVRLDASQQRQHTCTVFTDASAIGYGAVAHFADGSTKVISRRWTEAEQHEFNLAASTVAEPRAVELIATELFASAQQQQQQHITIVSDHAPLVFAGCAGYGRAISYNTMCRRLQGPEFAHCTFGFAFIPGAVNPADKYSRFFGEQPLMARIGLPSAAPAFPSVRVG
jgi:hypothetical protein